MTEWRGYFEGTIGPLMWVASVLALSMLLVLILERLIYAYQLARTLRLEQRYMPLVRRALGGDDAATRALVASPARHRLVIARLLIFPLIDDRDPSRIAQSRALALAMSITDIVERTLKSPWWWWRARALRAGGVLQMKHLTPRIVAALDDAHADVRGAALDALADLRDPASLPAIVVRLQDASLHRGRRARVLEAFGSECEAFMLELARFDPEHRLNYVRALATCGTALSRPTLCRWASEEPPATRAAAFEALAHVGLDDEAARLAIDALTTSEDVPVRAMAAYALHGWAGSADVASRLGQHLDDAWAVAVQAAHSLRSMPDAGLTELRTQAERADMAGLLASQMLWEMRHH